MSAGQLTIPSTPQTLFCGGLVSSAPLQVRDLTPGGGGGIVLSTSTTTNGGELTAVGGTLTGPVAQGYVINQRFAFVSPFAPGSAYQQYAVARTPSNPNITYFKTTAGTQVLTIDPASDGANWSPLPTLAVKTNGTIGVETFSLSGDSPPVISWLEEGYIAGGSAAYLVGRDTNNDAQLVVNGLLQGEGLRINNSINHVADPSIGTGTLDGSGTLVVPTGASDPAARIFITPTSAGTGSLYVVNKLAASFEVISSAGAGDAGRHFDWLIVNPVW